MFAWPPWKSDSIPIPIATPTPRRLHSLSPFALSLSLRFLRLPSTQLFIRVQSKTKNKPMALLCIRSWYAD